MADKKAVTGGPEPSTQAVAELFTSILNEVQKQVLKKIPEPEPLKGKALEAVNQFREIVAALALQPLPKITLTANPSRFGINGGTAKLTWSSTDAQAVSIDQNVGKVTPTAGGSIEVFVGATTIFTATAKGPCGIATATATVTVETLG